MNATNGMNDTTSQRDVDARDAADAIAEVLDAAGYAGRVWVASRTGEVRVYVSRQLSRGRQDMGYVTVATEAGAVRLGLHLDRNRAGVRDAIRDGMAARGVRVEVA